MGKVIIFTKVKEKSNKWPVLGHKIREQEEHMGIPSAMHFLSLKNLPLTKLSHTKAIKNNRHCNLSPSKYQINLGLSPLLPYLMTPR